MKVKFTTWIQGEEVTLTGTVIHTYKDYFFVADDKGKTYKTPILDCSVITNANNVHEEICKFFER